MDVECDNCGGGWDIRVLISSGQSDNSSQVQTVQRIASAWLPDVHNCGISYSRCSCNWPTRRKAELICEATCGACGGNSERVVLEDTEDVRIREGSETENRVASCKLGKKQEEFEEKRDWRGPVLTRLSEKFEEVIMKDIQKRKVARRLTAEATKILEWYAVLQGFIFLSAANTTLFTCSDLWGPAIVSIIIAFATASSVASNLVAASRSQPRSTSIARDSLQIHLSHIIAARTKLLMPEISVGDEDSNSLGNKLRLALLSGSGLDVDAIGVSELGDGSRDHIVALPFTARFVPILLVAFSMFVILSCSVILCTSNACPCQ